MAALLLIAAVALVAAYTGHYALWAWRHGYRRGAAGLAVLAMAVLGLPAYLLLVRG